MQLATQFMVHYENGLLAMPTAETGSWQQTRSFINNKYYQSGNCQACWTCLTPIHTEVVIQQALGIYLHVPLKLHDAYSLGVNALPNFESVYMWETVSEQIKHPT